MENKKRRGRKKTKAEPGNDNAKGYQVSLKPSVERAIVKQFGSLTAALKSLLPAIPNPNAFTIKK